MSAVWVRIEEAARGGLPARCARTGVRCMTRYRRRTSDLPAPLEWATWTDLWPRPTRAVELPLPLLPRPHLRDLVLRRTRDVTAGLVPVALVLLAFGLPVGRLLVASLLLHAAATVGGLLLTVAVRLDATGEWVRLGNVHPAFAEAVERHTARPRTTPVLPRLAVDLRRGADGEAVGS